jgi:6-phosphogluconate dehydrogenase
LELKESSKLNKTKSIVGLIGMAAAGEFLGGRMNSKLDDYNRKKEKIEKIKKKKEKGKLIS